MSHGFFAVGLLVLLMAPAARGGLEDFANFPVTGNSYLDGSFIGRDGSTWSYVQCQGSQIIAAPTPCLAKGKSPAASMTSGIITGGCGTLTFDWMKPFTGTVRLDVVVNSIFVQTVGGTQTVVTSSGSIPINRAGNFALTFVQHDTKAAQVSLDNISWTPYSGGGDPQPPQLVFNPSATSVTVSVSNQVQLSVSASEPDADTLHLWAGELPSGATFPEMTGASPQSSAFDWTPAASQTGVWPIVFFAGDKDGTNSKTLVVTVSGDTSYYRDAAGLSGAALKSALHDIISSGVHPLTDLEEDDAMKVLHTDPADSNNVILLYRRISMAKSLYNDDAGWNKEHCWAESRGLGSDGNDQNDVHNLYAADKAVNAAHGNLYFDESNPGDAGYLSPAVSTAPETSRDDDSWEPPSVVKGDIARALFYMDARYDGSEGNTMDLTMTDAPSTPAEGKMGVLTTMLAWHAADPPDAGESNRNELIFQNYQHNRNPFIDHPEWVASIWATNATPPVLLPIGTRYSRADALLSFSVQALATEGDAVTLTMSNAPPGAIFGATNAAGTFAWTPTNAGTWSVSFHAADNDGVDSETVSLVISPGTQEVLLVRYDFEDAATNFTTAPTYHHALVAAGPVAAADGSTNSMAGYSGRAISDNGWTGINYFAFSISVSNGYELVMTAMSFMDQASSSGPKNWRLRSSLDSYAADLAGGSTHDSFASNRITLNGLLLTNGTMTCRLYGYNASQAAGTWRIDTLALSGRAQAQSNGDNPASDDDEDGFSNWQEYVAGSNPTNPLSYLATRIELEPGAFVIRSDVGTTGRVYSLEYLDRFDSAGQWQFEKDTNALDAGKVRFDLAPPEPNRFYRIRAQLP